MATGTTSETKKLLNIRQYTIAGYASKTIELQTGANYKQAQKIRCSLECEGKYRKGHKDIANRAVSGIVRDHCSKYQASVLMQMYSVIAGEGYKVTLNMDALNSAYNLYVSLMAEIRTERLRPYQLLSINDGWVLAAKLKIGEAILENCPHCHALYLCSVNQNTTIDCPFCYNFGIIRKPNKRRKGAANH